MIVSFSGIDGSGKTTRSRALVELLRQRGLPASLGKPEYRCNDEVKDFCEWAYGDRFAYFGHLQGEFYISCLVADWLGFLARVLARSDSQILICDRYIHDVLAQAIHMKAEARQLRLLWPLFPQPQISYFLEISPEQAYQRLGARSEPPPHVAEELPQLRILHTAYRELLGELDWSPVHLDETTATEALADEVTRKWQQMQR